MALERSSCTTRCAALRGGPRGGGAGGFAWGSVLRQRLEMEAQAYRRKSFSCPKKAQELMVKPSLPRMVSQCPLRNLASITGDRIKGAGGRAAGMSPFWSGWCKLLKEAGLISGRSSPESQIMAVRFPLCSGVRRCYITGLRAKVEAVPGETEGEEGGGSSVWGEERAAVAEKGNLLTRVQQFILSHYD